LIPVILLIWIFFDYFIWKKPLKESVGFTLYIGIISTAIIITSEQIDQSIVTDYQLIVRGIVLGIAIFSLKTFLGIICSTYP